MNHDVYQKSRQWMYRNARPLDLARFQYHFEHGSKDAVITALSAYQNEDGGFGHALEADSFNPNSTPIQTNVAIDILWEIQMTDSSSPMIQGILKYLGSGKDFDGKAWGKTVPSNNDYPRAYWWTYEKQESETVDYNPTIELAAFVVMYADKADPFYGTCVQIVTSGVNALLHTHTCDEMHVLSCFARMTEFLRHAQITTLFDLDYVEQVLREKMLSTLTQDKESWKTGYACKPSQYFRSKDSAFYETMKDIAVYECEFIKECQTEDGTWTVNWDWLGYKEEWPIAKNWWKGDIVVKNLLYLKGIDE